MTLDVVKTSQLSPVSYKQELLIAVSDQTVPQGPNKQSYRLSVSDLQKSTVDWDITPTALAGSSDIVVTDSYNMTVVNGNASLDLNAIGPSPAPGSYAIGAFKTNITIAAMGLNNGIHLGATLLNDFPSTKPSAYGVALFPASYTAQQVADAVANIMFIGAPFTEQYILQFVVGFAGNDQQTLQMLSTSNGSLLDIGSPFSSPFKFPIGQGVSSFVFLGKHNGDLTVTQGMLGSDGATYDISSPITFIGNDLPLDTTMFFYELALDFGDGYGAPTFRPTILNHLPSYNVANTQFGIYHTQQDWVAYYPNGVNPPLSISYTQQLLPAGTSPYACYMTRIDRAYVGPVPTPYGVEITPDRLYMVLSHDPVNGTATFMEIPLGEQFQAITDTVSNMWAVVSPLSGLGARTHAESDEIVVYVQSVASNVPDYNIPIEARYSTIDAAYEYLITLPKTLKKRMVLDDRQMTSNSGGFTGISGKVYEFIANNITLSTYNRLNGVTIYSPPGPNSYPWPTLNLKADGLMLDHFEACFSYYDNSGQTSGQHGIELGDVNWLGNYSRPNVLIGDKVTLISFNGGIGAGGGGTIKMGKDSYLWLTIDPGNGIQDITIDKEWGSMIFIDAAQHNFNIYTFDDNVELHLSGVQGALTVNTLNVNSAIPIPSARIIRHAYDFGTPYVRGEDGLTVIDLPSGFYYIAGDIDLGLISFNIYPTNDYAQTQLALSKVSNEVYFIGDETSTIRGYASELFSPPTNPQNCHLSIHNVDIAFNGAFGRIYGNLTLSDLTLYCPVAPECYGGRLILDQVGCYGSSQSYPCNRPIIAPNIDYARIKLEGFWSDTSVLQLPQDTANHRDIVIDSLAVKMDGNAIKPIIDIGGYGLGLGELFSTPGIIVNHHHIDIINGYPDYVLFGHYDLDDNGNNIITNADYTLNSGLCVKHNRLHHTSISSGVVTTSGNGDNRYINDDMTVPVFASNMMTSVGQLTGGEQGSVDTIYAGNMLRRITYRLSASLYAEAVGENYTLKLMRSNFKHGQSSGSPVLIDSITLPLTAQTSLCILETTVLLDTGDRLFVVISTPNAQTIHITRMAITMTEV